MAVKNSVKKDSQSFDSCIAISPDSQKIVTFNSETPLRFKLYDIDDLNLSVSISAPAPISVPKLVKDKHLCWSIAISNCVEDNENERFIALSCFDARGFRDDINYGDDNESDLESGDKYLRSQTWVIPTTDGNEIYTSSIGGVIRFLDSDDSSLKNKTVIVIVHASGIYEETMNDNIKQRFFSQPSKIRQFELPKQLSNRLHPSHDNSLEILHTSIIKNHFMVHSLDNRKQIIEMYSLITGNLEMLFKRHESSVVPNIIHGSPIFAISQNEKILAFCRGTTSITLYFMENGLEIVTKQLEGQRGIYKIVDINFIDDDSKLLIILEEKEDQVENSKIHQIFVVWDLFTTFENSIRQIETSNLLKIDVTHRLVNSHGKMLAVRDNGDIFSVLDHEDMTSIRNPTTPSEKKMTEIDITRDHVDHAIYNVDGKSSDTSKLIINNVEPWHPNKSYFRISVYLDSTKSTQLIISSNTIQVWKYRNNNTIENLDKRERVLEYIWAHKKAMDVKELIIGEREFVLKVSVPSPKSSIPPPKSKTIHWPNNVNVLEGACRTLYVLREKKHIEAGHENVNQIKYLVECTQRLVRKYITKYGIFRLTSIRYPIMKYLIKGYQESLIKHILNKKINRKNSNIYIPRLYKWEDDTEISMSDLHHAILCIHERGDSTTILKYLIDYYADNAKEYNNYGWMFTVSKAIPLLYDYHLREFVQYLFNKPCFGITEAYTPPLHIKPYDQKKGNNAAVIYSLAVKPRLALKSNNTLWLSLKNSFTSFQTPRNDRKVYIVPLPDFAVYPNPKDLDSKDLEDNSDSENHTNNFWFLFTFFRIFFWPRRKVINNTKKMSPFLRVIHEEKGYEIYQTPTIMAVLGFKWSAARRYYIHHIIMYILYAISYTLTFESSEIIQLTICFFVYHYTGFYLIVTEIVQLKSEGWHRYMNVYNIFDLGSVLLPFANFMYLYYFEEIILPDSVFIPIYAFTDLVMWLEVLFLLRYFEIPGRFVYIIISILNTVLPFFAFMLSAVLAFGHAMFIALRYMDDSSLHFPTYKIEDTSNSSLYSNITIKQDIDKSYRLDNLYSSFISSVESVFFWTNGRWDQLDQWDNYAVDVISILGSIILVLIFQNMLIAFMNGAFDQANKESRTAAHRYRTERIESLEKPFSKKGNPRYIYYIPDPAMIDTWLKETKKDEEQKLRLMGENLAELTELTDFDSSDDDDCDDDDYYNRDDNDNGDDNQDNLSYSKKYRHIYIKKEVSSSTTDLDSTESSTTKYDKISFIDEEIFPLKFTSSKLNKKSQRNWKSNNKLLTKNYKSSYESLVEDHSGPNVDDQSSMQTRFARFDERFDEFEQNLKKIMETLNNLNNPK
ncbi:hypothetical protein Glove_168g140 [Diversispora epigaea]|uniref:Ion transport domain-containing protein n=1 Tax=Diversispora epigaea TaxID=1348612 RepID=A0A397IYC6_9GLOM|nr:hypothetical protein Glove_168g140 [Diversispora epigaea]